jgi:hypothetical protein
MEEKPLKWHLTAPIHLPPELLRFSREGYVHDWQRSFGDWHIYLRHPIHMEPGESQYHFEVVQFQVAKSDRYIDGRLVTTAGTLSYPSPNMWGTHGFTVPDLATAVFLVDRQVAKSIELKAKRETRARPKDNGIFIED